MENIPIGNMEGRYPASMIVGTSDEIGTFIRRYRRPRNTLQGDMVGLANNGNRFIAELGKRKSTLQLQKVLDVFDLIGLDVIVRCKGVK